MKFKTIVQSIFVAAAISASACNKPACENTHVILEQFKFDSKEYKDELAKQMDSIGTANLSYRFENYIKKNDQEFMVVNIQGPGLCAIGELLVNDWGKLAGIRKNSGTGYQGAELKGLKIQIVQNDAGKEFVFNGADSIID